MAGKRSTKWLLSVVTILVSLSLETYADESHAAHKTVGCDGVLGSTSVLDRCGKCKGDGSTCKLIADEYTKYWRGYGHLKADTIATLPVGTTKAHVENKESTYNNLGLQYENGTYVFDLPTWSKTITAAGSKISYKHEKHKYKDTLDIEGPTTAVLLVKFIFLYERNQGVKYVYYAPTNVSQPAPYYKWTISSVWSGCSASCAGGIQTRTVQCLRSDDNTNADFSACAAATQPTSEQPCNTGACALEWHVTAWSICSKTCASGSQSRAIVCRQQTNIKHYQYLTDSSCSAVAKPVMDLVRTCKAHPCLPEWFPQSWSQCSTSCGLGTTTRKIICRIVGWSGESREYADKYCFHAPAHNLSTSQECNGDKPCPPPLKIQIACFKANPNPLEENLGDLSREIDWDHTDIVIKKCSSLAHKAGYTYFALGNNGICYSGAATKNLYYIRGAARAKDCTNGVGKTNFLFAYTHVPLPVTNALGCFADSRRNRALPVNYANMRSQINWSDMNKTINACGNVARDKGYGYFAVQYYGECWSADDALAAAGYNKHGAATNCWNGVGGIWSNMVYKFAG